MGRRSIRIAVIAAAVIGGGLYLFWPLISSITKDTDAEGVFAVPGKRVVDLDEGTYGVYYREDRKLDTRPVGPNNRRVNESLPTPSGFEVSFRGLDGTGPPIYSNVFNATETQGLGDVTTKQVGRIEVSRGGRYEVSTEGETEGLKASSVTIGEDRGEDDGFGRIQSLLKPQFIIAFVFGLLFVKNAPWDRWLGRRS